ncbi:MAG: [LysW]-lysine hydrolase [Anaerolineales bacterium]|nr:[LysW]-lysine hydrolase [Anaerolineales bacterium]
METPETLFQLVACYSPSGAEGPVVEVLVERMRTLGFGRAFVDEAGNAVGVLGEGPRQILLLGHIDTVAGEIPPRVEDGILYGRGAVDAKGPLACMVDAAAGLGPLPGWQVVVIGAVDEERDSLGARHVARLYRPDYAIVGEPSGWERVTLGYKGVAWAAVTVRRLMSHTASGQESACEAGVAVWNRIAAWAGDFNAGRGRAFERVLPTLRGLDSGEDGFEQWTRLRIGVRLPPDLPPAAWYAELKRLIGEVELEPLGHSLPAYAAGKNTPLVRAFLASIRAAGGKPGFVFKTGTADLNVVGPAWGCPLAVYGPGDSELDHTPDEHLSLDEYARAVVVLGGVLRQVCGE